MQRSTSAGGAEEGSQGRARFALPLDPATNIRALKRATERHRRCKYRSTSPDYVLVNGGSIALFRARSFVAIDPGAARGALAPGYLMPRLRRRSIGTFMICILGRMAKAVGLTKGYMIVGLNLNYKTKRLNKWWTRCRNIYD